MKLRVISLFAFAVSVALSCTAQSIWSRQHLENVRQHVTDPFYADAYQALIADAEAMLDSVPVAVTQKDRIPASGDIHDYLSQARYAWPDPSKADGLPYIWHDGVTNPEIKKLDRLRLATMHQRVVKLTLAWYLSGDERYAQKAAEQLRAWFLDKDTRMNPNLDYAQTVPGQNEGRGRSIGLIDGYSFVEVLEAAQLLEGSKAWTTKDAKRLKAWMGKLVDWFTIAPNALEEAQAENNHGVAYDVQLAAYALYAGRPELAREVLKAVPERRIYTQIEPNGRQPKELERTLGFHYSQYNLGFFTDLMLMAHNLGLDIDKAQSEDGRSYYGAMKFLSTYLGCDASEWPWQQIHSMDEAQQAFCRQLYRAAHYLGDPDETLMQAYNSNRRLGDTELFRLIYVDPTLTDNAYAKAEKQLRYAIACADSARVTKENLCKRGVVPRTINKDGSLAMVWPDDWCSGFFAGTLWQMYDFTNDPYWRQQAVSYTWPIEDCKYNSGTHDLGFMIGDSFGKAWELTGEKSYRDVMLTASKTLSTRYNDTVGCIRSWDHNGDHWKFPVIIDNMMNLEMLFKTTQLTGDSLYWNIAVRHADTTMKNHFRPDYSSYHVVDYVPADGSVHERVTAQGYADESVWSRGQAWGLYGYTMCYRYTHDPKYLDQACHIADFMLSLPNTPDDGVFYWDMRTPMVEGLTPETTSPDVPRDASSAAILASGLYELAEYVPSDKAERYAAHADRLLESLHAGYEASIGSNYGFLLLHSTGHHPAGSEIDVPLNYTDYYYLEALARKAKADAK